EAIGGISSDGKGNIYIGLQSYIAKFDENFNYLGKIGESKVSNVFQIIVDTQGNIWAASNGTQAVVVFKPDGSLLSQFPTAHAPVGLAVDSKSNFYITTTDDNKVYIYDSAGKLKGSFGGGGRAQGKFWVPYGILVDASGNILVSDTENGRIQAFKGETYEFLWATGREFYEPAMMSWTKSGNILVADCFHNVVNVLSTTPPVLPDYDFQVRSAISEVEVKPGDSIKFNVLVKNTGSLDDTYSIKIDNKLASGWTLSEIPEKIEVKAGDQILLPVSVTVSSTAGPKEEGSISLTFASSGKTSLSKTVISKIVTPDIPPVAISIVGDKIPVGNTAVIEINADKVDELYAVSVTLLYDKEFLKVEKVESSGILGSNAVFVENHDKPGTVVIGYSLIGKVEGI
ncbi:MAG: hypothetical protein ACPLYF_02605, partial [Fervidobacterium sp.]